MKKNQEKQETTINENKKIIENFDSVQNVELEFNFS